jgi:hypothetical protein
MIVDLYSKIINLNILYENLKNQKNWVDVLYKQLINEKKRVFSFVRIRRDGNQINDRFNIKLTPTEADPEFIELDYTNYDSVKETKPDEKYIFGKMDGIYNHDVNNEKIAQKMKSIITKKLLEGEDFCVIGYGQSGAGKTSTLINLKKDKGGDEPGVLMELLKDEQITRAFNNINVKYYEIKPTETSFKSQDDFDIQSNPENASNYVVEEREQLF